MKEYLKMADLFDETMNVPVDMDDELYCGDAFVAEFCSRRKALHAAHAINSHDELVQMSKELLAALEGCAKELALIIDQHNEQNMEDGSWKYDHQTPWEAMQLVGKFKGGAA